jgi:putative flippase GtrA
MTRILGMDARVLIYLAGGVLSALTDIGLMQLLISAGMGVYVATSLGFFGGLLFNYAFHARVTFKSAPGLQSFVRYLCVVAVNYLLTLAFVAVSLALLDNALVGKILSLPVIAAIGFLLSKRWIYR